MTRLAILTSHPVQYYAPWFRAMAQPGSGVIPKVFYLWDFGVRAQVDPGFGKEIVWDIPLLQGYDHEFVPNVSTDPGTHHFRGLQNPELRTRVKAWQPDAVLLIGFNHASLIHFILRRGKTPLLFRGDSHQLETPKPSIKEFIRRKLRSFIFSKFRAFLTVGVANRDYFLNHGVPTRRLFRAPHAVDNTRFEREATSAAGDAWRQQFGIATDERLILFAGKFEPKKRPDLLLEAFAALGLPKVCLMFAGGGEWESKLREHSQGLGLNVRFAPFQNQSLMPAAYAAADVFVLPSSGNRETWGLAVNEAMASGLPVIVSSQVGGGPDLVIPGQTGWIFPANDCAALTECLRAALSDDARLQEMGARARLHVREHFNYEVATAGLRQALGAIASGVC